MAYDFIKIFTNILISVIHIQLRVKQIFILKLELTIFVALKTLIENEKNDGEWS